jgi:TPR repeat protein
MMTNRAIKLVIGSLVLSLISLNSFSEETLGSLKRLDRAGNISATYNLGVRYWEGNGVKQDYTKAVGFFKKAASKEFPAAMYSLGIAYEDGRGVDVDLKIARDWQKAAFDKGYKNSANRLAKLMLKLADDIDDQQERTDEIDKAVTILSDIYRQKPSADLAYSIGRANVRMANFSGALVMYKKAAMIGHQQAAYSWTRLVIERGGSASMLLEVDKMLSRAADSGHVPSMNLLAAELFSGERIPKDFDRGLNWLGLLVGQDAFKAEYVKTYDAALFEAATVRLLTKYELELMDRVAGQLGSTHGARALYLDARIQFLQVSEYRSKIVRLNDGFKKCVRALAVGDGDAWSLANEMLAFSRNSDSGFSLDEALRAVAWLEENARENFVFNAPERVAELKRQILEEVNKGLPQQDITIVQLQLAQLGYFTGEIDGVAGPETKEALLAVISDAGLAPSVADASGDDLSVILTDKVQLMQSARECSDGNSNEHTVCFDISL